MTSVEPEGPHRGGPRPFTPPLSTGHLPGIGGAIGSAPEHFVVEEIPAYSPVGTGDHLYLFVEKTGLNTADVARRLARAVGAKERDVGYAGMKDKYAVTRQWMSVLSPKDRNIDDLGEGVRVLEQSRHNNKLRTGHLHGNRFRLTLVEVDGDLEKARAIAGQLQKKGLFNAFGAQRFGNGGANLAKALDWLSDSKRRPRGNPKLLASVAQSEIFNRYLSVRAATETPLLKGEVVRLSGSKKHFVVEDPAKELERLRASDICPTGPLPGNKTVQAQSEARTLEHRVIEQLLTEEQFSTLYRGAPGARRDLFVHPEGLELSFEQPGVVSLAFSLPAGSFATQVAREFTRADWDRPRHSSSKQGAD